MDRPDAPGFGILFICTGNICRSPLADRLASTYLDDVPGVRVASAGSRAVMGSAMHPFSAEVLTGFGGEPAGFVARQLDAAAVASAQLVLGMTREHRRAALELDPRALARVFTVREAADLLRMLGDTDVSGETFPDRARALVRAMATARSRRTSDSTDDVDDPIGRPFRAHQEAGEAIAAAVHPLMRRIVALRDADVRT